MSHVDSFTNYVIFVAPLLIQHGGQLQVAVGRSPPVTLLCFHGFNLTLHFMVGSKRVYSSSKGIMG